MEDIYNYVPNRAVMERKPEITRQDVLFRLRWSILGSVDDIQIQTGLHPDGTEERLPFLSHPLAMESLTDPPIKRAFIGLTDISEAKHFYFAPENYQNDSLIMENADGSPLTIKDFVTQLHSHFGLHKDMILSYRSTCGFNTYPLPPDAIIGPDSRISFYTPGKHDLFFKHAFASEFSDPLGVSIYTFLEGERAVSVDAFCKSQRKTADVMAELRANPPEPWVAPEPICLYCDFVRRYGGCCDVHGSGEWEEPTIDVVKDEGRSLR